MAAGEDKPQAIIGHGIVFSVIASGIVGFGSWQHRDLAQLEVETPAPADEIDRLVAGGGLLGQEQAEGLLHGRRLESDRAGGD